MFIRLRKWLGLPTPTPQLDRTGPATVYPDRAGAALPPRQARQPGWNEPTSQHRSVDPMTTLDAGWRSSADRRPL